MKLFPNMIINFHKVWDSKWMERVFLLLKNIYNVVSLEDIEDYYYKGKELRNCCHITFDDGDRSFYTIAFPLIKKHQIPVSIYVSPQIIKSGKNFWFQERNNYNQEVFRFIIYKKYPYLKQLNPKIPLITILNSLTLEQIWELINEYRSFMHIGEEQSAYMSESELKEVYDSGLVAIGAHTQNHPILANETEQTSRYEIQSSILELSDMLGTQVKYFAYPNGIPSLDFGEREMDVLKAMDIKLAFSIKNKSFTKENNPLSIPRMVIETNGSLTYIVSKLLLESKADKIKRMVLGKQAKDYREEVRELIINNQPNYSQY